MELRLLDELENQHREAEALIAELEKVERADDQRTLVDQLATALATHMEIEVFPKLRAVVGGDPSPDMTKEELLELARQANIEGRSSMSKQELLTHLGR